VNGIKIKTKYCIQKTNVTGWRHVVEVYDNFGSFVCSSLTRFANWWW